MQRIKNVLFDLGKVLLNFDNDNAKKYFYHLGITDYDTHVLELHRQNVFNDFETGHLTANQFIRSISLRLGGAVSDADIQAAWNSILIDFRKESLNHLEKLKSRYELYLLSNTNELHYQQFNPMLYRQTGVKSLDGYFNKTYYSHQLGYRKPDSKIYLQVLEQSGIQAESTLFIDDMPENIAAAAKIGFNTHLLLPGERIENLKTLAL